MTKFLHYEVFKVHCGFFTAAPHSSGTFNILAHLLAFVKHFFNFFRSFSRLDSLRFLCCFAAGYFRQLVYITTLCSLCQALFLTFLKFLFCLTSFVVVSCAVCDSLTILPPFPLIVNTFFDFFRQKSRNISRHYSGALFSTLFFLI